MTRFWSTVSLLLAAGAQLTSATDFNKRFTTSDGDTYAYDYVPARANRTTVLLIHGYPASRHDWRYQISDLTDAGYGVIAPDCLGYGDTDKPVDVEAYHFKRLSGHFAELLDHEGIPSVVGVGHDWGSTLLSRVATWHPERFHKLAFMSAGFSAPGFFFDVDGLNALGLSQLGYMQLGYWYFLNSYDAGALIADKLESFFHLAFPVNNTAWAQDIAALGSARAWLTANTTTPTPEWLTGEDKATWLEINSRADAAEAPLNYYKSLMRGTQQADELAVTEEQLALKVPVLSIGGAQDLVTRADQLRQTIEPFALKGYTEKVVEGAGHWLMLEQREEVSSILLEFVGKC